MILALTTYSCRVKGCKEIWAVANDGSFDYYRVKPEWIAELLRDAHELREHADKQYEVGYDYD